MALFVGVGAAVLVTRAAGGSGRATAAPATAVATDLASRTTSPAMLAVPPLPAALQFPPRAAPLAVVPLRTPAHATTPPPPVTPIYNLPRAARSFMPPPIPVHPKPDAGVKARTEWQRAETADAGKIGNSPARWLRIASPELFQPVVGSECRGTFVLSNAGPFLVDLSGSGSPRYTLSIYRDEHELCRCGGSWSPLLQPGDELRTNWSTHYDSLSAHPAGPFQPFVIPERGEYRCRIELHLSGPAAPLIEAWETRFVVDH